MPPIFTQFLQLERKNETHPNDRFLLSENYDRLNITLRPPRGTLALNTFKITVIQITREIVLSVGVVSFLPQHF